MSVELLLVLIRDLRELLAPSTMRGHSEKGPPTNPKRFVDLASSGHSHWLPDLGLPAFELCEINLIFK